MTSTADPILRPLRDDDLEALVAINDGAYPAVPITPVDEFAGLLGFGDFVVVVDDGAPAGFLLTMSPGLDYASENYRWFSARSSEFLYIDRIVLAPRVQGLGLGRRLYEAASRLRAQRGARELFAEVNLEPPNPGSLAFHARMGSSGWASSPRRTARSSSPCWPRPLSSARIRLHRPLWAITAQKPVYDRSATPRISRATTGSQARYRQGMGWSVWMCSQLVIGSRGRCDAMSTPGSASRPRRNCRRSR